MTVFVKDDLGLSAVGAFSIVTSLSCIAILASVALMNVISRDWVLEMTTNEELTIMNSQMRGIDQACQMIASGLAGLAISADKVRASAKLYFRLELPVCQACCIFLASKINNK